jgi:hypothetical protein
MRPLAIVAVAALLTAVGWEFFAATTFIGDDHLFLTFARLAAHPLVPFYSDQHGGEYYRPLPMALWWLLARAGGGAEWPFALSALLLHAAAAALTGALVRACDRPPATAALAAALFFVAPGPREAALWFSASTDLLATTFTLGALVCLLRSRRWLALALASAAVLSKESALVLPLLAAALPWPRRSVRALLPLAAVVVAALVARLLVIGGPGGAGDPPAALAVRLLQLASGLARALVGGGPLPDAIAWLVGGGALLWAAWRAPRLPLAFVGLSLLPLLAAGWLVGARYFYLPAVGVAWLLAEALGPRLPAVAVTACLLALGTAAAVQRRGEIGAYRARLTAAADAVGAEARQGHPLVHVRCGIKDLDLALKNRGAPATSLAVPDVPASFASIPPALTDRTRFLLADPPLPPSGAYRFGGHEVVGLARREESPDLDEVRRRLPELRFVELFIDGRTVRWRDVTDDHQ